MGWQLVPTGIGWRAFDKTLEEGRFRCDNPTCKGRSEQDQPYRLRRSKNWFTVLFIPVIPLNTRGVFVECRSCKTVFPVSVLHDKSGELRVETTGPSASKPTPEAPPPAATSIPSVPLPDGREAAGKVVHRLPLQALPGGPHQPTEVGHSLGRVRLVFETDGSVEVDLPVVVGRDPAPTGRFTAASICRLHDRTMTVSKTHAAVVRVGAEIFIEDLGSANGVLIADHAGAERLLRNERSVVKPGATIRLGDYPMQLVPLLPGAPEPPAGLPFDGGREP